MKKGFCIIMGILILLAFAAAGCGSKAPTENNTAANNEAAVPAQPEPAPTGENAAGESGHAAPGKQAPENVERADLTGEVSEMQRIPSCLN